MKRDIDAVARLRRDTAAHNRFEVAEAQARVSTRTARVIEDLRKKGRFRDADAVLELTQNYLSQLVSMERWAAAFNLSPLQFKIQVIQWNEQFEEQIARISGDYWGVSARQYMFRLAN